MRFSLLLTASLMSLLTACGQDIAKTDTPAASTVATVETAEAVSARFVVFLDEQWEAGVARSPEYQAYLGRKGDYDKWDDRSAQAADDDRAFTEMQLSAMRENFDRESLTADGKLNYDLAVYTAENDLRLDNFRSQRFGLSQFRGIHSSIPVFLANYHRIENTQDAKDYIARVSAAAIPLDQAATRMEAMVAAGYPLPEFSYPLIVGSAENAVNGAPISDGEDISVLKNFREKVEKLEISDADKSALIAELITALKGPYAAGYRDFSARFTALGESETVSGNYGIGTRENGKAFYDALLASYTTTDLTAEEIHALGLQEVARIQNEMRSIMAQVEFDGDLQEFFDYMRTDPQFYYSDTDEGREAYLELARSYITNFTPRLDELFITKPKAPVVVKRVEPFRERASGKAFYNQPAPDGSRPGTFYANLAVMADMPIYQLEALVYHEAIPGHHMQRSIQIEMEGLPKFRQFGGYTAYTEGWGLYSELLPKEIGFYEDPYSDFGRLAMELWRAARLVVDTGLHAKGWEMQEAIDYLQTNTPNPKGDTVKAIERYIVLPGQATSYKIGMLKLLDLRATAKAELGDAFDIAEFHDLILTAGPLPLKVLEARVNDYIAHKKDH